MEFHHYECHKTLLIAGGGELHLAQNRAVSSGKGGSCEMLKRWAFRKQRLLSWPTIKWKTIMRKFFFYYFFFLLWKRSLFCRKIYIWSSPGWYMPRDEMYSQKKQRQLSTKASKSQYFFQRWRKEAGGFWFWWGRRCMHYMFPKRQWRTLQHKCRVKLPVSFNRSSYNNRQWIYILKGKRGLNPLLSATLICGLALENSFWLLVCSSKTQMQR